MSAVKEEDMEATVVTTTCCARLPSFRKRRGMPSGDPARSDGVALTEAASPTSATAPNLPATKAGSSNLAGLLQNTAQLGFPDAPSTITAQPSSLDIGQSVSSGGDLGGVGGSARPRRISLGGVNGDDAHVKARSQDNPHYPKRFEVPDHLVVWDKPFPGYSPAEWTHPSVYDNSRELPTGGKWADPPVVSRVEMEQRITFAGNGEPKTLSMCLLLDAQGKPLNPVGRTGLSGRGMLGKWGANQAADPIVTRVHSGRLQVVVVRCRDTEQVGLPGGMVVRDGDMIPAAVKRNFEGRAGDISDPVMRDEFRKQVAHLFESGKQVYRGYVDDPRNTDNAWTETTAFHFHCPHQLGEQITLASCTGADDAEVGCMMWLDVDMQNESYRSMYGAHRALIERAVSKMDGQATPDSVWGVAGWLRSLNLFDIVSDALLPPLGHDPFTFVQALTHEELAKRLARARLEGLTERIWEAVERLQGQQASTGRALSAKFAGEASFQMAVGSLTLYYSGLDGLVGPPMMLNGRLDDAICAEHCSRPDSDLPFASSNGVENVLSRMEWQFVTDPDPSVAYSERGGTFRDAHPEWCRKPRPLAEMRAEMEKVNQRLEDAGHTKMVVEELIGGRMYTGPMYEKYNAVLRFFSGESLRHESRAEVPYLQMKCEHLGLGKWMDGASGAVSWEWHNNYATTIHAINSCCLKLSKLTVACRVWRGFTGAALPQSFFEANSEGVKGGIEFGFSSTTVDRDQALHYAKGKASTVFEMEMGMIDRGADFSWLSQYPHEREILFSPLMGLQAIATRINGHTLIVEMRLNLNMQSLTLEEVVSKRRKVVKDMVSNVTDDFLRGLPPAWKALGADAPREAHKRLEALLAPVHQHEPELYNDDAFLGGAINEAVTRSQAVRGWADGLEALAKLCGTQTFALLERTGLDLEGADVTPDTINGIGMLLGLGGLRTLKLKGASGFGAAGAKRLAIELALDHGLVELDLRNTNLILRGHDFSGLVAITDSLRTSLSRADNRLRVLRLGDNDGAWPNGFCTRLVTALSSTQCVLEELDVRACGLDAASVLELLHTSKLRTLKLADVGTDEAEAKKMQLRSVRRFPKNNESVQLSNEEAGARGGEGGCMAEESRFNRPKEPPALLLRVPEVISTSGAQTHEGHGHWPNDFWQRKGECMGRPQWSRSGNPKDFIKWDGLRWCLCGEPGCFFQHKADTPLPPASGWEQAEQVEGDARGLPTLSYPGAGEDGGTTPLVSLEAALERVSQAIMLGYSAAHTQRYATDALDFLQSSTASPSVLERAGESLASTRDETAFIEQVAKGSVYHVWLIENPEIGKKYVQHNWPGGSYRCYALETDSVVDEGRYLMKDGSYTESAAQRGEMWPAKHNEHGDFYMDVDGQHGYHTYTLTKNLYIRGRLLGTSLVEAYLREPTCEQLLAALCFKAEGLRAKFASQSVLLSCLAQGSFYGLKLLGPPYDLTVDDSVRSSLLADDSRIHALVLGALSEDLVRLCAKDAAIRAAVTAPAMIIALATAERTATALELIEKYDVTIGDELSSLLLVKDEKGQSKLQALVANPSCDALVDKLCAANAEIKAAVVSADMFIALAKPDTASSALRLIKEKGLEMSDSLVARLRTEPWQVLMQAEMGGGSENNQRISKGGYSRRKAIQRCKELGGRLAYRREIYDESKNKLLILDGEPYVDGPHGSHVWTAVLDGEPEQDNDGDGWVQLGVADGAQKAGRTHREIHKSDTQWGGDGDMHGIKSRFIWCILDQPQGEPRWTSLMKSSSPQCCALVNMLAARQPKLRDDLDLVGALTPAKAAAALSFITEVGLEVTAAVREHLLAEDGAGKTRLQALVASPSCTALVDVLCAKDAAIRAAVMSLDMFVAMAKPASAPAALRLLEMGVEVENVVAALSTGKPTEYKFNEKPMPWQSHEDEAIAWGGHVTSITSMEEHEHVKKLSEGHGMVWIGARRIEGVGNGPGPRHWEWSDGTPWDFEHWGPNQPDNHGGREDRVQLMAQMGRKWNDIPKDHPQVAVYKRGGMPLDALVASKAPGCVELIRALAAGTKDRGFATTALRAAVLRPEAAPVALLLLEGGADVTQAREALLGSESSQGGQVQQEERYCASPNCTFRPHSDPQEWNGHGKYCCAACMRGGCQSHGGRCQRIPTAPSPALYKLMLEPLCTTLVETLCAKDAAIKTAATAPNMIAAVLKADGATAALQLIEKYDVTIGDELSSLLLVKDEKGQSKLQALVANPSCDALVDKLCAANAEIKAAVVSADMFIALAKPSSVHVALRLIKEKGLEVSDSLVQSLVAVSNASVRKLYVSRGMSWSQFRDHAEADGYRLPTTAELSAAKVSEEGDVWVPVTPSADDLQTGRRDGVKADGTNVWANVGQRKYLTEFPKWGLESRAEPWTDHRRHFFYVMDEGKASALDLIVRSKSPECVQLTNLLLARAPIALAPAAILGTSTSFSAAVALGLLQACPHDGAAVNTAVRALVSADDGRMIVDVDHVRNASETWRVQLCLERPRDR